MQSNRIVPALDVSDEYTQICVLDRAGDVVEEGRVRTSPAGMRRRFSCSQPMRIALEVGPQSSWLSRLLAELGHEVIVANPRKLRMIYQNDRKSDRADARYLRFLLVQAAHYILGPFGPDTDLRRWGLALASRGRKNAKKRAVVAVARKLAVLLHRLWVTAQVYSRRLRFAPGSVPCTHRRATTSAAR